MEQRDALAEALREVLRLANGRGGWLQIDATARAALAQLDEPAQPA